MKIFNHSRHELRISIQHSRNKRRLGRRKIPPGDNKVLYPDEQASIKGWAPAGERVRVIAGRILSMIKYRGGRYPLSFDGKLGQPEFTHRDVTARKHTPGTRSKR